MEAVAREIGQVLLLSTVPLLRARAAIIVGDSDAAIRFSNRLFEEGVFATSVVYPTVALDQARLRTIVTAALSDEHLDRALDAFARVGRELGIIGG